MPLISQNANLMWYLPINAKTDEEMPPEGDPRAEEDFQAWIKEQIHLKINKEAYFYTIEIPQKKDGKYSIYYEPGADIPFSILIQPEENIPLGLTVIKTINQTEETTKNLRRWFSRANWRYCVIAKNKEYDYKEIVLYSEAPFVEIHVGLSQKIIREIQHLLQKQSGKSDSVAPKESQNISASAETSFSPPESEMSSF